MTRSRSLGSPALLSLALSLAACGPPEPPAQAPTAEPKPTTALAAGAATPDLPGGPGQAHALVLRAASCWLGGIWSDALGDDGGRAPKPPGASSPEERHKAGEKRCLALVTSLYGGEDKVKYDQLRLIDGAVVDRLAAGVDKLATGNAVDGPHKEGLVRLLRALAAAQHENNDAHIAADTVRADLKNPTEPETLSRDEATAVKPLRAHAALEGAARAGRRRPDRRGARPRPAQRHGPHGALRGMPRHLKVYAVSDAYQIVFGVTPPQVPSDPTAKLVPGTWLTYLTDVARAAGHAVPDKATSPREREPWAWGGVIAGFGDKLRADGGKLAGTLGTVVGAVVKKLDAEWAEIPELATRQKEMGEREAKERAEKKSAPKK